MPKDKKRTEGLEDTELPPEENLATDLEEPSPETEDAAKETRETDELAECRENLLRLAAEYDNFRKRTAREREAMYGSITAETVTYFLPILDNLDRAAVAPTTDSAYAQGIVMIVKQFQEIIGKLGVTEIEALDRPFDSNLHNAVMHVEQEGIAESTVVEVFQKGYMLGDRVLRHSVVKVAN